MKAAPPIRRYAIARPARQASLTATVTALAALGGSVFLWLSDARATYAQEGSALPPLTAPGLTAPVPLPAPAPVSPPLPAPPVAPTAAAPIAPALPTRPTDTGPDLARERFRAPALIVDIVPGEPARAAPAATAPNPVLPPGAADAILGQPAASQARTLSDNEQFSARVSGDIGDVARAERLTGLDRLVVQGTIIGAVMETALNSDLPGFARATVQRDVLSFDGSAVLIPAGSRVIGEYKSGVAQGASRVFIVWTRLIRPDGASIALGSPAVDDLGRGGVPGKVNRHFLQRFGGSILLSVLTGGISAATAALSNGATVVVGSSGEASTLAQQAARDLDIPPTIITKAGTTVRIFVARDLDFSGVGPTQ